MPEMRADMLPDLEETSDVVKEPEAVPEPKRAEPATPVKKEEPKGPSAAEPQPEVPKGFVPYQALDEERIKRKEAERKLREIESSSSHPEIIPDDELSEEGKVLKAEIDRLNQKLAAREVADRMSVIIGKYPAITDKLDEFDDFRELPENKGLSLETAAKAFVFEKGLAEVPKPRKGLEKPTHGDKAPPKEGISAADIERLMKNDYRTFEKMVKKGLIDPDKIK